MHQVQSTAKTTSLPSAISDEAMAVRGALLDRGLETPMVANHLSRDQRYDRIREAFTTVMETLGLDLRDDSLEETPHRIAKMYVDEIFLASTTVSSKNYGHWQQDECGRDGVCRSDRSDQYLRTPLRHHRWFRQSRLYPKGKGHWLVEN